MKGIRVLLACSGENGNPYIFQLIRALENHTAIEAVQHGTAWLRVPEVAFDVVHIQWPEELLRRMDPSAETLDYLASVFARWRSQNTAIVSTFHNEFPHGSDTQLNDKLYKLVFQNSHAIVHLGERSKDVLESRHGEAVQDAIHAVIPHGNYEWFVPETFTTHARVKLGLPEGCFVLLSFGRIRDHREKRLLLDVARALKPRGGLLLVVGGLPHPSMKSLRHFPTRIPLWLCRNVRLVERFIPDELVHVFFEAADAVLVPRVKSLNSGNVALGYTFGKVVMGPEGGVIGEELQKLGNPTFDTHSRGSVKDALLRAMELSASPEQGLRNREYANTSLNWQNVAAAHVALYERLLRERVT